MADLEKRKKKKIEFSKFFNCRQRYFGCERLWYKLSLLKLRAVKLVISFKQFLQSSRSQIIVKKYEIMRTFKIRYENGCFFIRSLAKAVRNRPSEQMKN